MNLFDLTETFEFLKKKNKITGSLKSIGFRYITLDMEAIRSGSMD